MVNELIDKRLIVVFMLVTIFIGIVTVIIKLRENSFDQQGTISEQQAIYLGKQFLDSIGYTTGKVLSANLEQRTPNFYWHDLANLEKPDVQGLRLCWVIRFEQAYRPGHFLKFG